MLEALKAEHPDLVLGPAGPNPEFEASSRKVVDGDRYLGQQRGMSVDVASDHGPEANALRGRRDRGEQRPALIDRSLRSSGTDRCQVVKVPNVVEAALIGDPPNVAKRLHGGRLARVLEAKPQGMCHS